MIRHFAAILIAALAISAIPVSAQQGLTPQQLLQLQQMQEQAAAQQSGTVQRPQNQQSQQNQQTNTDQQNQNAEPNARSSNVLSPVQRVQQAAQDSDQRRQEELRQQRETFTQNQNNQNRNIQDSNNQNQGRAQQQSTQQQSTQQQRTQQQSAQQPSTRQSTQQQTQQQQFQLQQIPEQDIPPLSDRELLLLSPEELRLELVRRQNREQQLIQQMQQQQQQAIQRQEQEERQDPARQLLEPFGYDLFSGTPGSFAAPTNIPAPSNYIMGPDDSVIIQLYGQRNQTYELIVNRDGSLMFPEIGPISVAGLTYQELREQIQNIVSNQLIGQSASVTLGALRSISVFVLGEAIQPGTYTVSSLATMTNALFTSGGVTPVGSLRNIRLMRNGETVSELDLYDLLLRGDTSADARLQAGDVIFIPPVGTTVGIMGEVRRAAIYELKNENTAGQVISLTGGLLPTAFPAASRIERINAMGERVVVNADLTTGAGNTPALQEGDIITVASVLDQVQRVVTVSGHVERPGRFEWRDGMRVSDVLPGINALRANPDLEYALIAREVQPTRRIELIYINPAAAINNPGSADDLQLQPRDELIAFGASQSRQDQVQDLLTLLRQQATFDNPPLIVNVRGNVRFPGIYPLVRNMTLNQAIRFAGGLDANAELDNILVERRTDNRGSIDVLSTSINPASLASTTPIQLQEQDKILVFNANQPREELLEDTLETLRAQATSTRPTQIVSITGQVRFPGDYPLVNGLNAEQLIELAGGLRESADTTSAEITRFDAEPDVGRITGIINLDLRSSSNISGQNYQLSPFDRLVVRQMPNWTEYESVTIGGEVNSPGTYTITKDEPISSLIARAGGLTQYADARAAIFLREELRLNEQRMLVEFRDRLQRDIINRNLQSSEDSIAGSEVAQLLALVEEVDATGRLVIDLPTVLAHTGQNNSRAQQADVILRNGDQLLIPRTQQEISVIGEVNRATSHLYQRNNNVSDYIGMSGGYTRSADQNNVFIIKASGEVVAFGNSRWFFQQGARLEPGDTIIVPYNARQTNYLRVWTSVSQILFNISTTLLAIERVGN